MRVLVGGGASGGGAASRFVQTLTLSVLRVL